MARLMLSAGMFSALAAAMAPRRRGLPSGSPPPPVLAAIVISLMRRVKILPRLASRAPFLCLIVAHFEWPDMDYLGGDLACTCGVLRAYSTLRSYHVWKGRRLWWVCWSGFVMRIFGASVADL